MSRTGTAERLASNAERRSVRISWWYVPLGAAGGVGLGATARLWMRWISTDPDFTWSGTIAIVLSFAIFAAAQSAAAVARLRTLPRSAIAGFRSLAAVLSIGLFSAAGSIMFPTVLFGSLALWRCRRLPVVRVLFALLSLPSVIFVLADIVDDHGWRFETMAMMWLFVLIYAAIIAGTWPLTAPLASDQLRRPASKSISTG